MKLRRRIIPLLETEAELDALPQDALIGTGSDTVYQRIYADSDPDVQRDIDGNPCVWAGIAFDGDPEYYSSAQLWHTLTRDGDADIWYVGWAEQ